MNQRTEFDRKKLKQLRVARGWKTDRAAVNIGISRPALENLEKGKNAPNARTLMLIARTYEVPMDAFFPARGNSESS